MADDEELPPQPVWEGPFSEDGLPHGKGVMKYPPAPVGEDEEEKPGDSYEGTFEHGKRHGKGTYTWGKTGATFVGTYKDGVKHGQGKMTFPDKSTYEGGWVNEVIEGTGRYIYSTGDIYQGEFMAGKRHGQGSYHNKTVGCQFVGRWQEGGFVAGHWILKDGSMFAGSFEKGVNPVEGAYYFSSSRLLQAGSFASGGEWAGAAPPFVGSIDALQQLAPSASAASATA